MGKAVQLNMNIYCVKREILVKESGERENDQESVKMFMAHNTCEINTDLTVFQCKQVKE